MLSLFRTSNRLPSAQTDASGLRRKQTRGLKSTITGCMIALLLILPGASHAASAGFGRPQPVPIYNLPLGYGGAPINIEEPFVSRDGRFLFFNSGDRENKKDLHYAEQIGGRWQYRGEVGPRVNTPKEVEANPTMDAEHNFFYIDGTTKTMVRVSRFNPMSGELGALLDVKGVPERSIKPFKRFQGNMGVEVSADGDYLYFSRATWKMFFFKLGPFEDSDILFSKRKNGKYIYDEAEAKTVMKNINTPDLEYAASVSADGLELFFTRLSLADLRKGKIRSRIMYSTRDHLDEPFGEPHMIDTIGSDDFVEGPSIGPNGTELYYHRHEGPKSRLYKVSRALSKQRRDFTY